MAQTKSVVLACDIDCKFGKNPLDTRCVKCLMGIKNSYKKGKREERKLWTKTWTTSLGAKAYMEG